MFSRKGRIYSFGSLTLAGLVASLVNVATQSPEATVAAGAITATAAQTGILSILQNKGFELTLKLLENLGAISTNLGTDDARQILIKVAESLNKSDGEHNHDIAKAVRQAILSIIENEKEEIADKDDKTSLENILKTTEETWAWVELLEQDNLLTITEEKIPHFFSVKTEDIAKIESPVKESEWKLILLEIAGQNNCTLTQESINKISASLYKKFPQALREVFAQDFANEGIAYGKLLLALVGDLSASQEEIAEAISNVSEKQDKYHSAEMRWLRKIYKEIKKPPSPPKIPTKLPVSKFPSRVNFFTGRKAVLGNIETSLKEHKTAALCGTHGLGKSSIATEFAYLNAENYAHVLFIRAFGAEFNLFISEIVNDLPFETDERTTPDQKLGMLQHWLAENENWLLILDNVNDVSAINACKFTTFGGDVLFTSNDELIWQIGKRIEVPTMDTEEAASLLYQHWKGIEIKEFADIPEEKRKPAKEIAEKFGNSPLAMTFVGVYLAIEKESLDEFLETYHDKRTNLLKTYEFLSNYQHENVAAPFLLAFEAISKPKDDTEKEILVAEAVKDYLKLSAFLAPNDIPEDFLEQCVKKLHAEHTEILEDKDFFKQVRKRLAKSSFCKRDSDKKTFTTHRLAQEIMRFEIKDEENLLLEIIADTLDENVPFFDYTNKEKVEPYVTHLESFIEYLEDSKIELDAFTNVLSNKTGLYYNLFGQYEIAKKYYSICRDFCEKTYGNNHAETAGSYNNLGLVYDYLGDYVNGEENHLKALQIRLNIFGKNHPDTATSYNNLGVVYQMQGSYAKAEENHLKSLQIYLDIYGENHPDVAKSYVNLGEVYASQGNYINAEENHLKALPIHLDIYGENHPDTARCYNNLGYVYNSLGNYTKAEENLLRALLIRLNIFEENHPDVAMSYTGLGNLYASLGNYANAEENHLKALKIYLKFFGENHPHTAGSYNNLGAVYDSQGDYAKAEENHYKALRIFLNIFDENHPNIAMSYNNLGFVYANQEKLVEAENYYRKALEIFAKFLPKNHPFIQRVKNNLEIVREKMREK